MFDFKQRRRRKLKDKPFPMEWEDLLNRNVSFYKVLSARDQEELKNRIKIFIHEKQFEGCASVSITDEIRITVAAQACLMLLGDISDYYPKARSILIYPDSYVARVKNQPRNSFVVTEGYESRIGEAWSMGNIVLAWNAVLQGAANSSDGRNVVIHEFAHNLDHEFDISTFVEASPAYAERKNKADWIVALSREYRRLLNDVSRGKPTLLNQYGATNTAEFFAVSSEVFFEQPSELKKRHPELFQQLRSIYQLNPIELFDRS